MFWSFIPLVHAFVFGLAAVVFRFVVNYTRYGTLPSAFKATDSARDFTARCYYIWLPLVDFALVVLHALDQDPLSPLEMHPVALHRMQWVGAALLIVSLIWVIFAQAAMGREWRMGVDEFHAGRLLTAGPFKLSRHPIYTGIRLTLFGQLLLIANWPAFCVWMVSELLAQLQARFEEEAMMLRHGLEYRAYCAAVRRWL